jgi:hypothetical protein
MFPFEDVLNCHSVRLEEAPIVMQRSYTTVCNKFSAFEYMYLEGSRHKRVLMQGLAT